MINLITKIQKNFFITALFAQVHIYSLFLLRSVPFSHFQLLTFLFVRNFICPLVHSLTRIMNSCYIISQVHKYHKSMGLWDYNLKKKREERRDITKL